MPYSIKSIFLAAGIATASATGASAALLDFTALGTTTSGSIGSVGWSLSATGGNVVVNTKADAPAAGDAAAAGLALDYDGVGVKQSNNSDDEVTNRGETLTLSFSRLITLQAVHFLDLFVGNATESARVKNVSGNTLIVEVFGTDNLNAPAEGGYAFKGGLNVAIKDIRFVPGAGNDNSNGDFALAGIEYKSSDGNTPDPVPLPAAGLLLAGALGGLGLARRRKKA